MSVGFASGMALGRMKEAPARRAKPTSYLTPTEGQSHRLTFDGEPDSLDLATFLGQALSARLSAHSSLVGRAQFFVLRPCTLFR
jgi:hypothetical protein